MGRWLLGVLVAILATGASAQEPEEGQQAVAPAVEDPVLLTPLPLPIQIIPDEGSIEAQRREAAESRRMNVDNLEVQRDIKRASQTMAMASVASVVITLLGSVMLFVTLLYTRTANKAARDAVAVTRDIGQRQIRAYVNLKSAKIRDLEVGKVPVGEFDFHNSGQSPAKKLQVRAQILARKADDPLRFPFFFPDATRSIADIGPGTGAHVKIPTATLTEEGLENLLKGNVIIHVWGFLIYYDVFGKRRKTLFRSQVHSEEIKDGEASFHASAKNNFCT